MGKLVRFGVSLDEGLLKRFDKLIRRKGYASRSEAIRDLIRADLVAREWEEDREVVGVIMLVFDHHQRDLQAKITEIEHRNCSGIISSQHIHLDHHNCLEVVIVRDRPAKAQELTDRLKSQRGIKHCSLSLSTTAKEIS